MIYKPNDKIEPIGARVGRAAHNFIHDMSIAPALENRRSPGYRRVEPFMTGKHLLPVIGPAETVATPRLKRIVGGRADLPQWAGLYYNVAERAA